MTAMEEYKHKHEWIEHLNAQYLCFQWVTLEGFQKFLALTWRSIAKMEKNHEGMNRTLKHL